MIPKVIHYFWFGDNLIPEKDLKNIESWKKYNPDYEIKLWNEKNYQVPDVLYVKQAVEAQKWSHVSDYARLDVLYQFGGIYLDTDVEIIKPFDELLSYSGFAGFEDGMNVNTGQGIGAEKNNFTIKGMMDAYREISFINDDGSLNLTPCPVINTEYLKSLGLRQNDQAQQVGDLQIFPTDYFCPKSLDTGVISITSNTYSIHHFNGSWHSEKEKRNIKYVQMMRRIFGTKCGDLVAKLIVNIGKIKRYFVNKGR